MPASVMDIANKPIAEKIRKLLALADRDRNSHEHERNVAIQAAMDLLAKHNLSMAQVHTATLDFQPEEIHADFKLDPWVRIILSASCRMYYTSYYISGVRHWNGRIERYPVFVGTPENIHVTINMASWLINSVRLESNRTYRDAYERRSFRLGAADRIFERASNLVEKEKSAAATSGTDVMIIRNQLERANQEFLAKKNLGTFRGRSVYLDDKAYADGEDYGNQVGLKNPNERELKRLPQLA